MAEEEKVEVQETPQMPEAETKEQPQVDPTQELKGMLEQYNVNSPDDFSGLINELNTYKKGYGDSRNEVGELRRELDELRASLSSSNRRYRQPPQYDEYGNEQPQSVDLNAVINESVGPAVRRELESFMTSYEQKQSEAAEQYWAQRNEIESRPNWDKIQPMFDKAIQNPTIMRAMQSGRMTMDGLYSRLNERYLLSLVNNLVTKLPEDANLNQPGEVGTQSNIPNQPTVQEEQKQKVKKAVEDKNPDAVLENLFPDNDPIFQT